jgi:AcrR family transcriptional regulator
VQQRSAARIDRLLDACAEMIDETGYEALSTTVLARRAGMSVGAVYQFFPDKHAVVLELTRRLQDQFAARVAAVLDEADLANWWEASDVLLDAFVEMCRTVPGYRSVQFKGSFDTTLQRGMHNNDVNTALLADALAARFDLEVDDEILLAITIAVEVADGLVGLAFRRHPTGDPLVIDAAKAMIRAQVSQVGATRARVTAR